MAGNDAILNETVRLPCGAELPNRIAKAAMTEGLGDRRNRATDRHVELYRRWGEGGAGLLVTGNVLVDRWHLERPGNLAIAGPQDDEALAGLKAIARAGTAHGSHLWMQLNHAGRQTQKAINPTPKAPSTVALKMRNGRFGRPVPLTETEITDIIDRFAFAARTARETGFTGVQMHAAHGYLASQFLSPLSNPRDDRWGGSLENRARFLVETVRAMRKATARDFVVSVKLNSADFQRGGFSADDSATVAKWLEQEGVDLIEISGGNYEQPRMIDFDRKDPLQDATYRGIKRREAYFLGFVPKLKQSVDIPVMVTGGFRSLAAMEEAAGNDMVDVIGLGRPFLVDPDAAHRLLRDRVARLICRDADLRIGNGIFGPNSPISFLRDLNAWGALGWYYEQVYRLADGKEPDLQLSAFRALLAYDRTEGAGAKALER
ncbi:MAG: NADH:flavin oxidoreductase/NADH oxidase family protein [Rhizobiaceae bacterium]